MATALSAAGKKNKRGRKYLTGKTVDGAY